MKQYAAIDDIVYFWFAANTTSGSGGDGASPAADVRLAGAAADAAPVYSPTPSLLSHANYPAGAYEIAITASVANGFATGNTYAVFCTLAIDSQNPTGFVGSFDLKPVESNLVATGADAILKDSTFALALADAICDEVLTGDTHNIVNSLGRRVREIGAYAIDSGTAQAGDTTHITLAATASAIDGTYNRNLLVLTDNTGVGQTRTIIDYDGSTKIAIVDREWRTNPDATSTYQIVADDTPLVVDQGVAQAGSTSTTIKLRAYASSINDTYLCNIVIIIAGTGRGQARLIGSYDGTTKVVTICGDDWITTPDDTSVYVMIPYGATCTSCMGDDALAQINAEIGIAKNVALPKFDFYMVLSSDHVSAATGKTVTGKISKDGGAFASITNAITEVSNGMYKIASGFTQTEMNADIITLKFTATDCDQRMITMHTT